MVDILITGTIIASPREVIRDGYVYVKDGVIEDVGGAPVPDDYTFAGLLLGGRGRIIAPGLVGLIDALAYPIRFERPSMTDRLSLYQSMDPGELATGALPAIYEAHLSGITTLIVEGIDYRVLDKIEEAVGGRYYLALPVCYKGDPTITRLHVLVADDKCNGRADVHERGGWGYNGDSRLLAMFSRISYSLANISGVYEMSYRLAELAGLEPPVIRRGRLAELVVYNTLRPPAMMLHTGNPGMLMEVYSSGARVESLIIGRDVLVDVGEHLYIADKQLDEARRIAEKLISR